MQSFIWQWYPILLTVFLISLYVVIANDLKENVGQIQFKKMGVCGTWGIAEIMKLFLSELCIIGAMFRQDEWRDNLPKIVWSILMMAAIRGRP